MNWFFSTLPRNVIGCFKGWNILYHLTAIALTLILVTSGIDWAYFRSTRSPELRAWMFPAVIIGQGVPMMLPLFLLLIGIVLENAKAIRAAWALGQAVFIGWFISSCYKALTGRDPLPHGIGNDTSRVFRFGFLRDGIFWGWPSSHTAVAFAMAVTALALLPRKWWLLGNHPPLRPLHRCRRFHDHPLVLGFCGWCFCRDSHWNHHWEKSFTTTISFVFII